MIPFMLTGAAAVTSGLAYKVTITVSALTPIVITPNNCYAYFKWKTDGTKVYRSGTGSETQIHADTDWIQPNGAASADFDIRYTSFTGSTLDYSFDTTENSWIALSANRQLGYLRTSLGTSELTACTIEIRGPDGVTLASGAYTSIKATVETSE